MARRYPPEFHVFMREYIPGHTDKEVAKEATERFGIEVTASAVKSYKQNHKIRSGTPSGLPKGHPSDVFPQQIVDYILKNYKGTGNKEMAERLNEKFGTSYTTKQLNSYYKNHGLKSGLTGRFEKRPRTRKQRQKDRAHTPEQRGDTVQKRWHPVQQAADRHSSRKSRRLPLEKNRRRSERLEAGTHPRLGSSKRATAGRRDAHVPRRRSPQCKT